MIPALTPYISRYYDDWRRGSRRWCSFLGILPYADDVLSDVLESLCRRPEAFQFDLLAREQAGERPLLFYVFGALRTEAILYAQKYRVTCSIERFPQLKENDDGSGSVGRTVRRIPGSGGDIPERRFHRREPAVWRPRTLVSLCDPSHGKTRFLSHDQVSSAPPGRIPASVQPPQLGDRIPRGAKSPPRKSDGQSTEKNEQQPFNQ